MGLGRRRPVIYNAHNIESELLRGRPGLQHLSRLAMRRYERRLLAIADESWMVSRADMASAERLVASARLRYVPNAVDVARIATHLAAGGESGGGHRLLMVGDFNYTPNRRGLLFLVEAVLPLVWAERPDTTLSLVGRGLDDWPSPDPRVRATGFVDSLDPYYAEADCVVVPLTEGAGTPLKFVEALAYGMPVVATPLAAKGLEVEAGVHYFEGADAERFAEGVLQVLRDGGAGMGVRARALAEREYSIESLAERIAAPVGSDGAPAPAPAVSGPSRVGSNNPLRFLGHAAGTLAGRRYPFVLCYHGVGSIAGLSDPSSIFVGRSLFESHLDEIAEHGYELLPVGELWARIAGGGASDSVGSITFDDGLVKTVREALPTLADRGIRCSMFIPTGLMGRPHPDVHGELIVSREEVREMAQAGVEIGAHSVDHVRLNGLGYAEALDQMRRSRLELEDLIGSAVTGMAYPFGAFDGRTMSAAREAGYTIACACSGPGPWLPMCLPREPVYASATPLRMRLKMAGLYGPAHAMVSGGPLQRLRGARIKV